MAAKSSRTTFAKLDRERRLREKRAAKQARRDARKESAANPAPSAPEATVEIDPTDEEAPA